MFQIDRSANRLRKLERTSFSEVGFREREHLQEWLATMPDALCEAMSEGEDGLLIIQKEFDGFDGTRERLDLLALDRAGQLVIIENKLDDSGRDVVWQALKYAAYCSSLKKAETRETYEQTVGEELEWRRIDDKKVSMVVCKTPVQGYSKENWPEMIAWLVDHYRKMDGAFSEPVRGLAARMKPGGGS